MEVLFGLGLVAIYFIVCRALKLVTVFCLFTVQKALSKCSPANRTMSPGLFWLQLIPFLNLVWR